MSKDQPSPGDSIKPRTSALRQFTSTVLACESLLVVFATLVAFGLRESPYGRGPLQFDSPAAIWVVGGTLAVVLLVLSRMTSSPGGYLAGSLAQLPVLGLGLVVPMMYLVGGVFVVLWIAALRLGSRIDRERAAYDAAHPETAPNVDGR